VNDNSANPANITAFYGFPNTTDAPRVKRQFDFDNRSGNWTINDKIFACDDVRFTVQENSVEQWTLNKQGARLASPGPHPLRGVPDPVHQRQCARKLPRWSRKAARTWRGSSRATRMCCSSAFRDFVGKYPIHCHNVVPRGSRDDGEVRHRYGRRYKSQP